MENIFTEMLQAVKDGAKFTINFQTRSMKVNGKYIIKNGEYEGNLGFSIESPEAAIGYIENYYTSYRYSRPSERSESRRKKYFLALPENELDANDMMYGETREVARFELEYYVLVCILNGSLKWENLDLDCRGHWFWQSKVEPGLIIMKSWITQ